MLLMSRRHPKGLATTEPPLKLPIEGDNPTLRDSRIVVKKNQLADTLATSPLGYSPSFGR